MMLTSNWLMVVRVGEEYEDRASPARGPWTRATSHVHPFPSFRCNLCLGLAHFVRIVGVFGTQPVRRSD